MQLQTATTLRVRESEVGSGAIVAIGVGPKDLA
jgi:hypothetical protein